MPVMLPLLWEVSSSCEVTPGEVDNITPSLSRLPWCIENTDPVAQLEANKPFDTTRYPLLTSWRRTRRVVGGIMARRKAAGMAVETAAIDEVAPLVD